MTLLQLRGGLKQTHSSSSTLERSSSCGGCSNNSPGNCGVSRHVTWSLSVHWPRSLGHWIQGDRQLCPLYRVSALLSQPNNKRPTFTTQLRRTRASRGTIRWDPEHESIRQTLQLGSLNFDIGIAKIYTIVADGDGTKIFSDGVVSRIFPNQTVCFLADKHCNFNVNITL